MKKDKKKQRFVQLCDRSPFDHRIMIFEDGGYFIAQDTEVAISFRVKNGVLKIDK